MPTKTNEDAPLSPELLEKVRAALSAGTPVPPVLMSRYEKYHTQEDTMVIDEHSMEMEVNPERYTSNAQHASPFDDVIPDESGPTPIYTDEVYWKMWEQGVLVPGEDPYMDMLIENSTNDVENNLHVGCNANLETTDEDHEAAFLAALEREQSPVFTNTLERSEDIKAGIPEDDPNLTGNEHMIEQPKKRGRKPKALDPVVNEIKHHTNYVASTVDETKERIDKMEKQLEDYRTNSNSITMPAGIKPITPPEFRKPGEEPKYGEEGWTEYVIAQMVPSIESVYNQELKKVVPKYTGLRRLCEQLIGPIMDTHCEVVVQPTRENLGNYTIKAKVMVKVTNPSHPAHGDLIIWSDLGTIFANQDENTTTGRLLMANPTTSAYTAALSRCFKNILGLVGIHTSEEMGEKGKPQKIHDPDRETPMQNLNGPISPKHIVGIHKLCRSVGADPLKVARKATGDNSVQSIGQLSARAGQAVYALANSFQSSLPDEELLIDK